MCVCVIHLETVRTLLALSYGSATNLGFECGFEGSSPSSCPLGYTATRGRVMRLASQVNRLFPPPHLTLATVKPYPLLTQTPILPPEAGLCGVVGGT